MSFEIKGLVKIIKASSLGSLLEWYDFYIFGSLAAVLSSEFFPKGHPTAALLSTLAILAAGFIVRPFGALIFGRLGDTVGRKYTFVLTLLTMGGSTFAIGLVPKYETIGFAAPLIVLLLRVLQGLALGGEYGGAAIYVAEHSPEHRRGFFTSWIQTTAAIGLLLSLGVTMLVRHLLDPDPARSMEKFNDWGWRIPFLLSIVLVVVSIYIRLRMGESPLFNQLQQKGRISKKPLKESFGNKHNLKWVLVALFGATMGQGVVFYISQFYALSFLENTCHIDFDQSRMILLFALIAGTPLYILFGKWSDNIGRKWIMMAGMVLAVATYPVLFRQMLNLSDTAGRTEVPAQKEIRNKVEFIGKTHHLLRSSSTIHHYEDGFVLTETKKDTIYASGRSSVMFSSESSKSLGTGDYLKMVLIVFIMVLYVTMVYGPIAAFLVELFPTRIRYTSLSLPYHIGNGVFGGLAPFIAVLLSTTGNAGKLSGLLYPTVVIGLCAIIGILYIPGKRALDILKKGLGVLWIILAPVSLYFLLKTAIAEISRNPMLSTKIQWSAFVIIYIPIAVGLVLFGRYALKGDYVDKTGSGEITAD